MPDDQNQEKQQQPPQHQDRGPGLETEMTPKPEAEKSDYRGSGKLEGKVAVITGADSGIGRAVPIAFAKEGADLAVMYLNEHEDAAHPLDLSRERGCRVRR